MPDFFKLNILEQTKTMDKLTAKQAVNKPPIEKPSIDTSIWDPTGVTPNLGVLSRQNANNQVIYDELKKNPGHIKLKFYVILLLSFIAGGGIIASTIAFRLDEEAFMFGLVIMFSIPGAYHMKWKKTGKDLIKSQIAKAKGWTYNPSQNAVLRFDYATLFKEIFRKGDESQVFEDIFWGRVKKGIKHHQFVAGNFEYYTVSRGSKGRKHRTKHTENFFAIKLPQKIKTRFYIYPEGLFSKIGNFFTKKELNTESNTFNKTFAFKYNGSKDEKAMEIVKVLSPRVQEELVRLNESGKNKGVSVLFSSDTVIFSFKGALLGKMKTDFVFKSTELHPDDTRLIEERLDKLIDISTEIVKYLD